MQIGTPKFCHLHHASVGRMMIGKEDGAEDEAEDEAEGGAEGLDNRRKRSLGDVEIGDNMATIFERSPNRSE